jgi:hypothetical protein
VTLFGPTTLRSLYPASNDFRPLSEYYNSYTPESLEYWEKALERCELTCHVYQNPFGGRNIFALGSIITKSGHLRTENHASGSESTRDYSIADANEAAAIQLVPKTIITPRIIFAGKVRRVQFEVQIG